MPGAGHIRAANYVFSQAPKDGTTIGTFIPIFVMAQVLERSKSIQFNPANFQWLVSTSSSNSTVYVWHTSGVKSVEDATKRQVLMGGTGVGSYTIIYPTVMNSVLGTKFKLVTGYQSTAEIGLAMERGEIEGRAGNNFNSLKAENGEWLRSGKINLIAQVGLERDPEFANVPLMTDFAKTDEERANPEALLHRRRDRPAVRDLAGRAGGARGAAAQGVRRDDEGPRLSRRRHQIRHRHLAGGRREDPEDRRRFHEHSGGHRRQGQARDGAQEHRRARQMKKLHLSIATEDYDHFRDFRTGAVQAEGIEHTWLMPELHEIFARFTFNREWDVSELSFAKFSAQVTRKNADIIALPVVCSRHFRFSAFYVNKKSKIKTAKDLKGKKVGSPEWAHTAAVYMRGWLDDEHGVGLKDVHWYQAGTNEAGRTEKVELSLPKGVKLTRVDDKSLSDMLAKGEIDCALVARPPDCFMRRAIPTWCGCSRLSRDGGEVLRAHQSVADHACDRDQEGDPRRASLGRRQPLQRLPGIQEPQHRAPDRAGRVALSAAVADDLCARRMRDLFDGDPFPFGIEENRPTLEQFLRYTHEQGIAHRHAKVEEIFPKGMMVESTPDGRRAAHGCAARA